MDPLLLGALVGLALLAFLLYYFLGSFAFGAGFEPSSRATVRTMIQLAEVRPSDVLIDLGAGTGAIVFAAVSSTGARAIAVEREPIRYAMLRLRRSSPRYRDRVTVRREDLFTTSLDSVTVVTLFLWPSTLERLRPRLESALPPGTRVVSYYHRIRAWTPQAVDPVRRVYLYRVPGASGSATGGGT